MDHSQLHPNLARIAAAYDLVISDWAAGRLNGEQARQRVDELVARDDQGVAWRLWGTSGQWQRRTLDGDWVSADPPTWGLATPDGWDLSGGADPFADPRRHIVNETVSPGRITDRSDIAGSTLRAASPGDEAPPAAEPPGAGHPVQNGYVEQRSGSRDLVVLAIVSIIAALVMFYLLVA